MPFLNYLYFFPYLVMLVCDALTDLDSCSIYWQGEKSLFFLFVFVFKEVVGLVFLLCFTNLLCVFVDETEEKKTVASP